MLYLGVVVVVVILVVALFVTIFVLPRHSPAPSSSGTLLVASGHAYDVFGGQSASVSFTIGAPETLHGAFRTTFGITVFVLTDAQYRSYVHKTTSVPDSQWASGSETSGTIDVPLPVGSWNLAFIDLTNQSTSVLVTSDVYLSTP
ncbi:MAG TPA: hypothetical protein VJQ43_05780 [Thermoplasmata archaeon]|nr:hypothetical protein [Thermoplasmata archaeon]